MALSFQQATSDGTLVLLDISFDYYERDEVTVLFDDVEDLGAWSWVGAAEKKIAFSPAVANGVQVRVQRRTNVEASRHSFSLGAKFDAATLDDQFKQVLRVAQESQEGVNPVTDILNDVNMHGKTLTNLRDAVAPQEPATKAQLDATSAAVFASETAAAGSASAAATSASASATSASAASTSAGAAATSAATAATLLDNFDDRYLGSKASDPVLDNDGNALLTGALYWNATSNYLAVYSGAAWFPVLWYVLTHSQTFSGDGVTTEFTLDNTPASTNSLDIFISGVKQYPGDDYSVTGSTLTFTTAPPVGTANILAQHQTSAPATGEPVMLSVAVAYQAAGTTTVTLGGFDTVYHATASAGGTTWAFAGAAPAGEVSTFILELTNGGSQTQTWPASVTWDGGVAPALTASGLDILTFYTRDGGTTWRGFLAAEAVA